MSVFVNHLETVWGEKVGYNRKLKHLIFIEEFTVPYILDVLLCYEIFI